MTQALPESRCARCAKTDDLIRGDGPIVCRGCVEFLTTVAVDPREAGPTMRQTLAELHAEAVVLVQPDEASPDLIWRWVA